jgi:hypothetical protein
MIEHRDQQDRGIEFLSNLFSRVDAGAGPQRRTRERGPTLQRPRRRVAIRRLGLRSWHCVCLFRGVLSGSEELLARRQRRRIRADHITV